MDFELTDEQRLIQDTVRALVDERVLPVAGAVARVAFQAKMEANELPDVRLVFDNQYAGGQSHRIVTIWPCVVHTNPVQLSMYRWCPITGPRRRS